MTAALLSVIPMLLASCGGGASGSSIVAATPVSDAAVQPGDTSIPPLLPQVDKIAVFLHPVSGNLSVNNDAFTWSAVAGAEGFRVVIGTQPTSSDIFDSGLLEGTVTAVDVPPLPSAAALYARLWTLVGGVWRFSDAVFSTRSSVSAAAMVNPTGTAGILSAGDGFQWSAAPMARSYRMRIGTTPGAADVFSGMAVRSTRQYIGGLPVGRLLYGTLTTNYFDGSSAGRQFVFEVSSASISFADEWAAAMWAAGQVRQMASVNNEPFPNTNLAYNVQLNDRLAASCTDFASSLLDFMSQDMGLQVESRIQNVCLNPNSYDCHTLVELRDPGTQQWRALDPTFGLAPRRAVDGSPATATDISLAARAQGWNAISYAFLTDNGNEYVRNYYLDYPLLFVNVYGDSAPAAAAAPDLSIAGYFTPVASLPVYPASAYQSYAIQCATGIAAVDLVIDGSPINLRCDDGLEGISHVFLAGTIELGSSTAPGSFQLLKPVRNSF